MNETFVGQIDFFTLDYVPIGYLPCDGRLLTIKQSVRLFSLLGTTYGGDGVSTFALPDLRGRAPVGIGLAPGERQGWSLNTRAGAEAVALAQEQTPVHNHLLRVAVATPTVQVPTTGCDFAGFTPAIRTAAPAATLPDVTNASLLGDSAGKGAAHNNMQPYLVLQACICCDGVFPVFG